MPSGRVSKRPGGSLQDSFPGAFQVKLPRLERGPEDFSQVVKDKLQSYTRTGQACDRCKVRKIRCDGLPEGCSPCAQQNLPCYVTDRVTGRTERRGYLQQLERERKEMMTRLHDMEKLLEDQGIQVRPWQWTPPYGSSTSLDPDNDPSQHQWTQFFSLWIKDASRQPERSLNGYSTTQQASPLQTANPRTADACLGVAARGAHLCSINNANANSTTASQFAAHPQHNLAMTVKQEELGSAGSRRPSLQSNSTTPSSMVNASDQSSTPCHNPSMTAPTAAYPQMGYADLTQSAMSEPTSASSSMQSNYMPAVTGESAHPYLYTTSAPASAAAAAPAAQTNHTPPTNSPQATHNPMVGYYNAEQAAATQTDHHQQQAPPGWMYTGPWAPNGMPTLRQVPNGANPWPEWTHAIAIGVSSSSQDRYGTNTLVPLGSERRRTGDPGGGGEEAARYLPRVASGR